MTKDNHDIGKFYLNARFKFDNCFSNYNTASSMKHG